MQKAFLLLAVAIGALASTGPSARAEYVFRFTLAQQQPGAWIYGGFGSFSMSDVAGEFEVNVVDPYAAVQFDPAIVAPAGTLSFSLGTGVPTTYPFGWDFMYGTQYTGSFASSAGVLGDMLAGRGELQLVSASGTHLTAGIASLTAPGDSNGDGAVDLNDLTIVLAHFGQTGMTWSQGEFTGGGTVDINDLTIVLSNFSYGVSAAGIKAVPEPSTIALVLTGAACLLAGSAWQCPLSSLTKRSTSITPSRARSINALARPSKMSPCRSSSDRQDVAISRKGS